MSRHLLIRCDAPGCAEQTETRAPDSEPASVAVPDGWSTVRQDGTPDRHFCSRVCLARAYALYLPRETKEPELEPVVAPEPAKPAAPPILPPQTFPPAPAPHSARSSRSR